MVAEICENIRVSKKTDNPTNVSGPRFGKTMSNDPVIDSIQSFASHINTNSIPRPLSISLFLSFRLSDVRMFA